MSGPATKQSAAVAQGANDLLAVMQQLAALRARVNEYVSKYNANNWGALWAALPTASVNADGSLGAADGTPNPAHPVDTRVVATLAVPAAPNDLTNGVALLQAFQAFLTNQAVATANRNAVLDLFQQG